MSAPSIGLRWLRFNAVGVLGFLVQVEVVSLLVERGAHYLPATALAIEAAILHNFLWHARWTWRDRAGSGGWLHRFGAFNALHGGTALLNLACMAALVEGGGLPYLPATFVSVGVCSLLNFFLCHAAVFSSGTANVFPPSWHRGARARHARASTPAPRR